MDDIRPNFDQNILVKQCHPRWFVRIADFGISKRITDSTHLRTETGTRHYMAPEVMGIFTLNDLKVDPPKDGGYSLVVDVWSLGVLAFQLLTNSLPFPNVRDLASFVTLGLRLPSDSLSKFNLSVQCIDFIDSSLAPSPLSRPAASQLQNHDWLKKAENLSYDITSSPDLNASEPPPTSADNEQNSVLVEITEPSAEWSTVRPETPAINTFQQQPNLSVKNTSNTARNDNLPTKAEKSSDTRTLTTTIGDEEFDFDDLVINSAAYRKAFAKQMKRIGNESGSLSPPQSQILPQKRSVRKLFDLKLFRRPKQDAIPVQPTKNLETAQGGIQSASGQVPSVATTTITTATATAAAPVASEVLQGGRIARMSPVDGPMDGTETTIKGPTKVDTPVSKSNLLTSTTTDIANTNAQSSEPISSFRDYFSSDDITPGVMVSVLWSYEARAPDEFSLERGDMIKVVGIWDDGWGRGIMLKELRAEDWTPKNKEDEAKTIHGEIRAFPFVCVTLPEHWKRVVATDGKQVKDKTLDAQVKELGA